MNLLAMSGAVPKVHKHFLFTLLQVVALCLSLNAPSSTCLGSSCPKTLQSRTRKGKALRYFCKTSMHQILQNFVLCNAKRVPSEFLEILKKITAI